MPQRICPSCTTAYPDTQTNCVSCSDTPVALEPGTMLPAALALGEVNGQAFKATKPLGIDRLTIRKTIGFGAMAITYLVTDQLGNQRAMKEMRPHNKPKVQTHLLTCFLREAQIQYKVGRYLASHTPLFPPLPRGYGCFEQAYGTGLMAITRHYMMMDYMEGRDWDGIQGDPPNGALPLLDVLQLGMELCITLRDYLHGYSENGKAMPILHRDIKPANVLRLRATSTSCLLDFGIARDVEVSAATMARGGTRAGSAAFAPPEHNQRGVKPTPTFDTYCVCSSLYSLLANAKDFPDSRQEQIDGIRTHVADVEMQALLTKGTNEAVGGRYQTAEELRAGLERVFTAHRPLPSHLIPAIPTPSGASALPAPAPSIVPPPADTTITWINRPVRLEGTPTPNRFSQVLSGRVIQGGKPVAFANVVVARIIDDPGGSQSVNVATTATDIDGIFTLDNDDTRVGITTGVSRKIRTLSIRVEDAGGLRLTTAERVITQPSNFWGNTTNWIGVKKASAKSQVTNHWLAYLLALCLLAALIGYRYSNPQIWKAATAIVIVGILIYAFRRIKFRKIKSAWQPVKQKLTGLNVPVISITGYLLVAVCLGLAYFAANQRNLPRLTLAFIMGIFVLSLMSAIKNPGFFNRLLTMLSAFAGIAWFAFNYL